MSDDISQQVREKTDEMIERHEGLTRSPRGFAGWIIKWVAVGTSGFFFYAAQALITTQLLRGLFVMLTLFLIFLVFPATKRQRQWVPWFDWALAVLSILPILYMAWQFEEFIYRTSSPNNLDLIMGLVLIALVIEATRRTSGLILAGIVFAFLVYVFAGQYFPAPFDHRGYDIWRIVGHMYLSLEGIFGIPIDVAATYVILFVIYGSFLDKSGAGKFFIDFSFSVMGGKPTGAGRTALLASFLLGGPSGSGVATTVTIGSVSWPMLRKAGYDEDTAGGLLAAGGLGAILSPPIMGAAAFLICEMLGISYLEVFRMAVMPTILYYWCIFLMVEFDAKKFGAKSISVERKNSAKNLLFRYGYHFISPLAIVVFLLLGFSGILAVFWSIVICFAVSFLRRESALVPSKLVEGLKAGTIGVLQVAGVCAGAGMIVGVVSLTGLGLQFSTIIIHLAGGNLFLTLVYTAFGIWVIGLAVPITACYLIAAVITAPAMIKLGVPDYAAHMFIFYYAILSEVTPPTALNPFAAAAITGGNPYKTTMMSWKYVLPAFLVPFVFTIHPNGIGLLLKGSVVNMIYANGIAIIGVAALASGMSGWLIRKTSWIQRFLLIMAGLILVVPSIKMSIAGLTLGGTIIIWQWATLKRPPLLT